MICTQVVPVVWYTTCRNSEDILIIYKYNINTIALFRGVRKSHGREYRYRTGIYCRPGVWSDARGPLDSFKQIKHGMVINTRKGPAGCMELNATAVTHGLTHARYHIRPNRLWLVVLVCWCCAYTSAHVWYDICVQYNTQDITPPHARSHPPPQAR